MADSGRQDISMHEFLSACPDHTLKTLDVVGSALNPAGSIKDASAMPWPPMVEGMPPTLVSKDKAFGLIRDLHDLKMRVRCLVFEMLGHYHMRPHQHKVERRNPGIIFRAHEYIIAHREVNAMFDEEGTWDIEALRAYNGEFALGLEHNMQYACERGEEQYAKSSICRVMQSYGD